MTNDQNLRKEARSYFSQEIVPQEIHNRIVDTCRTLQKNTQPRRRFWGKKLAVSATAVAAACVLLCGVNQANPAFAEGIPLIGIAFRLYNEGKTSVGTYMGTYEGVAQLHSPAEAMDAHGLSLTLEEAYCDGAYIHLTFSMAGASNALLDGLDSLGATVTATANDVPLEEAYLSLHAQPEVLLGAVSLPLQDTGVQGQTIALQYQVTDLVRYFDDGGKWESLPGSFTGKASLQVNTSANQTFHHFAEEGEIKIHGVEATPSYTKIDYTIPFWGFGSYTVDFPRLYTTDGTPIAYNLQESQVPSPEEISRDAATISGSACFDGLPSGTEQVVLRFLEEDLDPYTLQDKLQQGSPVRVLAEVTLDFTTGEVTPSQTYLEAGMTFAEDYRTSSPSIRWTMPWDDPNVLSLGPCDWADLTAIPALFQEGNSLWSLQYDGAFSVEFVTDGPAPQKDLQVTITNQAGDTMAAGTLPHHSAVEQTSGNDSYFHWEAFLAPQDGRTPQLLDTLTVTLTEPDSGETLYQRSVRLTWRR